MTKTSKPGAASERTDEEATETIHDFKKVVNMSPGELGKWLETKESREVGFKGSEGAESVGHRSGRRIVRLLGKADDKLTTGDIAHMRKVVGYVHRHSAQRPSDDITETPWRYSLMNWGHDPKKPGGKHSA